MNDANIMLIWDIIMIIIGVLGVISPELPIRTMRMVFSEATVAWLVNDLHLTPTVVRIGHFVLGVNGVNGIAASLSNTIT